MTEQMVDFDERLTADRGFINDRLAVLLPPADTPPVSLHEAMRYAVLDGGKRLRGLLCMAVHRIYANPFPSAALDAACALELLHAYTLIHDDLPALDDDRLRRGKPCCHLTFGEATAILAGDALQALSFEVIARCGAPAASVNECIAMLGNTAGSRYLVGGQIADLEGEGTEPTPEMVSFIHTRKTAALLAASLSIGAVLAGTDRDIQLRMHEIGRNAGLAFQIIDDLLDIEGDEVAVGKGLRKDKKKGKITYPACHGVKKSRAAAEKLIGEAIGGITEAGDEGYVSNLFTLIIDRIS